MKNDPVKDLFDRLAPTYRERYSSKQPYHRALHLSRLERATAGLDLAGKNILDLGAGTGGLYDFLSQQGIDFFYTGCDLSARMLAQSNIPVHQQICGHFLEVPLPENHFDFVFLLGFTSYLSGEEWSGTAALLSRVLRPGGMAVISFTNRQSLDYRLRLLVRRIFPVKKLAPDKIIGQSFVLQAFSPEQSHLPGFRAESPVWFNPALFPLQYLLPTLGAFLSRRWPQRFFPRLFFGDFLVRYHLDSSKSA